MLLPSPSTAEVRRSARRASCGGSRETGGENASAARYRIRRVSSCAGLDRVAAGKSSTPVKRIQCACRCRHPRREFPTSSSTLSTPTRQPAWQLLHVVLTRKTEQPSLARAMMREFAHAIQFTCDRGRMVCSHHLSASSCLPAFRGRCTGQTSACLRLSFITLTSSWSLFAT